MSHNWASELVTSVLRAGVTTADPSELLDLHADAVDTTHTADTK